jgi:hypothetical protein
LEIIKINMKFSLHGKDLTKIIYREVVEPMLNVKKDKNK